MLGHFGQVIWYGFAGGDPEGNLTEQLFPHLGRSVGIRFFSLFSIIQADGELMKASITTLMKDLAEKRIQPQIFEGSIVCSQDCVERCEFRGHRDDEESWDSQGSSQTSQLSPNPMRLFNPPQLPLRLFLPNNTPTAIPKTARRRTPKLMRKISTTAPFNPQEIVRFLELPFLYTHVRFG